jgi:pSer/pThr/pTyr-binding forkhead associated (FHA) protein
MKAKLIGLDPGVSRRKIDLRRLPATVGRSPQADVRVQDSWISRLHCEISRLDDVLVVRDLESTNGTLVNGQHVREALLLPGDRLTVGISTFRVHYKRTGTQLPQPADQPQQAAEKEAQQHAGGDGEVEPGVSLLNHDVAGQVP